MCVSVHACVRRTMKYVFAHFKLLPLLCYRQIFMACVLLQQTSVISLLSARCNKLENRERCVHILKFIHIRHWKHSLVISGRFNHPRGRHFMMLTIVTFFGDFMDGNFYYCVHWLIVPCLCAGVICIQYCSVLFPLRLQYFWQTFPAWVAYW